MSQGQVTYPASTHTKTTIVSRILKFHLYGSLKLFENLGLNGHRESIAVIHIVDVGKAIKEVYDHLRIAPWFRMQGCK